MNALALVGSEWVLWLLIGLSILSLAVMIERGMFLLRRQAKDNGATERVSALLAQRDLHGARDVFVPDSMEARVLDRGLRHGDEDVSTIRELMAGELVHQRARFERRLIFLGTLGNNAPFLGLFGTVLGIIRAFRDLALADPSQAGTNNAQTVMYGISEALVATAVGLAVALPAVIAFNYLKSLVKRSVVNTEALARVVCAHMENARRPTSPSTEST